MTSNFNYRYVSLTPEHTTGTTAGNRTYGTKSNMSASGPIVGEVDDESFALNFDLLTRGDMSRYGAAKSINGKEYSEGGINLVMQPDDTLGFLLYAMYGDEYAADGTVLRSSNNAGGATSTAATGYTVNGFIHTWKEVKNLILPSFTIEVGREEKEHTYTGMCLSTLSINASHGEYATISADFTGKSESAVDALLSASDPQFTGASLDGFHFANGTVSFSSTGSGSTTVTTVKSINLEFNMNLDTDAACSIGSRTYIRQPQPQMREITGTVEFSVAQTSSADANTPDYETALATGGALWDGATSHPAIQLDFTNGSQSLAIEIRKVRWEAPQQNVSGRDTSTLSLSFVGLVDTNDNVMSTCVLTHTNPSTVLATGIKYSQA